MLIMLKKADFNLLCKQLIWSSIREACGVFLHPLKKPKARHRVKRPEGTLMSAVVT
jgi:hypothetical protein